MGKVLEGLKVEMKAKIHIDLLRPTLKKVPNWKTSRHDGIYGYWFKKFTSIHDRLASKSINTYKKQTYPNGYFKKRLS